MMLLSTAASEIDDTGSFGFFRFGAIIAFVIAAVIFAFIACAIVKSGKHSGEPEDETFYLKEIRKYIRIIALLLLGVVYFTIVWFIISA